MKRVDVAYVLLLDEDREHVLMVKNKGDEGSYYTLPGGAVEEGETLEAAAIREVKEETGLMAEVTGIHSVGEGFFEKIGHHAVFFTFTGKIAGGKIEIAYPEEIEEVLWVTAEKAETYLHMPEDKKGTIQKQASVPYLYRGTVWDKS